MSELKEQLKALRHGAVQASPAWVKTNRELLLSQIKNTVPKKVSISISKRIAAGMSIFMPESLVLGTVRTLAIFLIAAIVAPSLYYGTVFASEGALPGEGLYEAKRYTETIQSTVVGLIGDNAAETQLHVEFAKRRADETSKIVKDPSKISNVAGTVADLKNEINTINDKLNQTKNNKSLSANVARDIKQNTDQIKDVLTNAKNDLLSASSTENKQLANQVKDANNLVQDVSVKAVEVLVTKHLEGDQSVSKQDVQNVLNDSAQSTVEAAAEAKVSMDGVKSALESAKAEVRNLAGLSIDPAVVSSTKVISEQINNVINQTDVASQQTDAANVEALQKAVEVKQLVNSDNLTQAVDKIRELSVVTKNIDNISDNTLQQTQPILPIAQAVKDVLASSASSTGFDSSSVFKMGIKADPIFSPSTSASSTATGTAKSDDDTTSTSSTTPKNIFSTATTTSSTVTTTTIRRYRWRTTSTTATGTMISTTKK